MIKETTIIVPTYNNAQTLGKVLRELMDYNLPVLVINDGSTDHTSEIIDSVARDFPQLSAISYKKNKGKGFALKTGLREAKEKGYRYAITIDSDGQHYPDDLPNFLEEIAITPDALLVGARNLASDNMPGKNTFANKFSNFWFRLQTGVKLADTQSGYRLYPLCKMGSMRWYTAKYEFELEVLVFASWKGTLVRNIPVKVYYPPEGERISHFRPFADFTRISILNTILVLMCILWVWPSKLLKKLTIPNLHRVIKNNITHSKESNFKITLAIMLGLFMGIVPIWGYQMIAAAFAAHLTRLNKVITMLASNISIPPMIPFILYGSCLTGAFVLKKSPNIDFSNISFEYVKNILSEYILGSIIFALIISLLGGIISFLLLSIFRRKNTELNG